jgi:hypothetical protein
VGEERGLYEESVKIFELVSNKTFDGLISKSDNCFWVRLWQFFLEIICVNPVNQQSGAANHGLEAAKQRQMWEKQKQILHDLVATAMQAWCMNKYFNKKCLSMDVLEV